MEQIFPSASIEKPPEQSIRELIDGDPDAIFVFGGSLRWNEKIGQYESGSFQNIDENSGTTTGGKDRVLAAVELHRVFSNANIVPMSRPRNAEQPTYASVMKGELISRGVPEESITERDLSVDTITELREAIRLSEEKQWKSLCIVSSTWHIPRIRALLNHIENFVTDPEELIRVQSFVEQVRSGSLEVQYISSEDVLTIKSSHYKKLFEELKNDEGYQKRLALEAKAVAQIDAGSYGPYTLTKKIFSTPGDTRVFQSKGREK